MKLYPLLKIFTAAMVTIIIRFLPFIFFSKGNELPKFVKYFETILPPAVMSVLLVYCLKSVEFTAAEKCIPQLISVAVVILLHIWKRNTLLSISFGTLLYMILFQFVF